MLSIRALKARFKLRDLYDCALSLIEPRFQRYNQGISQPGALPQAKIGAAPLALNTINQFVSKHLYQKSPRVDGFIGYSDSIFSQRFRNAMVVTPMAKLVRTRFFPCFSISPMTACAAR